MSVTVARESVIEEKWRR